MKNRLLPILLAALSLSAIPNASQASTIVDPGWDLFQTLPGTSFAGVPFQGVPLGAYDFGGTIGINPVGNTDTIVQRLAPATAPSTTIPIELVALHLMSTVPVDLGLGVDFYFVTLQKERGGPASPGQMTIQFGAEGPTHGTFSSFFDVFFDVRRGGLGGPIALSSDLVLTSSGTPWSHDVPPGAVVLDGVNHDLNGSDTTHDFWPVGAVIESHPTGAQHVVTSAVPEPSSAGLVAVGLGIMAIRRVTQRR